MNATEMSDNIAHFPTTEVWDWRRQVSRADQP